MLGSRPMSEWIARYAESHQHPVNRLCHTLQFVGHYFEGKPPEFFHDWRFLLVGLRWWLAKIRGRA
jgi:uncharacterized membrane protein YGL010W